MARRPQNNRGLGLSREVIDQIDWNLAVRRVLNDLKTDFIWTPQFRYLLRTCTDEVITALTSDLEAGRFYPGVPMTIEVPKPFRILVGSNIRRLGPNFSRPGSILPVPDRVLYQAIADKAAPLIEPSTDRQRSFSHQLAGNDDDAMFLSNRVCWSRMQQRMREFSQERGTRYVLRLDIADYFGSINQHTLINLLRDQGLNNSLADKLEEMLLAYTGERNSRGILQGIYPSDLFGAFYLNAIDRFFDENNIVSVRYVDDIYIFVPSVSAADGILRKTIPELRKYGLRLNEAKSKIIVKTELFTEEPDLEDLFREALQEISAQIDDEDDDEGYGFQTSWDEAEEDEDDDSDEESSGDLELEATKQLFDSIETYPGHEESIERFCLPMFSRAESDYAVEHVMGAFSERPSMTQIYCSYLGKFIDSRSGIREFLVENLEDEDLYDWQKIWMIACLHQSNERDQHAVRVANDILYDATAHEALRSVAATYVGRMGDAARRRSLYAVYQTATPHIQYAMYYSSRRWPRAERRTARTSWGTHGYLNQLYTGSLGRD